MSNARNNTNNGNETMTTNYAPAQAPADIILSQLGGAGRLTAMIGAKHFFSDDDGRSLVFKFAGSRKANYAKITLTDDDLYTVDFKKIRGVEAKDVESFEGVYADMLRDIFESTTGLYLSV